MAINSSILAWKSQQTEEPVGLQAMGLQRVDMTEQLTHTHTEKTRFRRLQINKETCSISPSKPQETNSSLLCYHDASMEKLEKYWRTGSPGLMLLLLTSSDCVSCLVVRAIFRDLWSSGVWFVNCSRNTKFNAAKDFIWITNTPQRKECFFRPFTCLKWSWGCTLDLVIPLGLDNLMYQWIYYIRAGQKHSDCSCRWKVVSIAFPLQFAHLDKRQSCFKKSIKLTIFLRNLHYD